MTALQCQQQHNMDAITDEIKSQCRISVLSIFPDIDPDHLTLSCEEGVWQSDRIIEKILNQQEDGTQYPKAPRSTLKRKRSEDEEDPTSPISAAKKWNSLERRQQHKGISYFKTSQVILQQYFPQLYMDDLRRTLDQNGRLLYPTFLALHKAVEGGDDRVPPLRKKAKFPKNAGASIHDAVLDARILAAHDSGEREALEEFRAARSVQLREKNEAEVMRQKEQQELDNLEMAKTEGNIADCGCCFTEYAINRMVHCDGDVLHWFCQDCARMMAETQIGLSKHNLDCMSTDGCSGGFSVHQREIFLDVRSRTALDRIEAEAALREAGIEDLETCPFCPFAMEYPPLEDDREFRCLNPDCKMVSCRACRKETHIPKTCEESALEEGHSARHTIEEAMSAALIRKCNKCSAPFIKENGCNKMTCTKCRNTQCYICSKSCDYSHFNDVKRGGKDGNCPLFDEGGIEIRHSQEVKNAEAEARRKVLAENSDIQTEFLEFRTSEKVKQDEERRKKPDVHRYHAHVNEALPLDLRLLAEGRRAQVLAQDEAHYQAQRQAAQLVEMHRQLHGGMRAHHARQVPPPAAGMRALPPRYAGAPPQMPPQPVAEPLDPPLPRVMRAADLDHLHPFGGFGGVLGGGLNQAVAQVAPGIRQSMPPHAPPAGRPLENANQNPRRAGRVAPEIRPLNPFGQELFAAQQILPDIEPFPAFVGLPDMALDLEGFLPLDLREPPQQQEDYVAPQPSPEIPPRAEPLSKNPGLRALEQRGRHALDPIDLSSPQSVVDLTGGDQVDGGNQQNGGGIGFLDMPNPFLEFDANGDFPQGNFLW